MKARRAILPCQLLEAVISAVSWSEFISAIWLEVNGETRQRANLSEMIWNVAEIVAELSTYYELRPGDLIFTGTPEGVGPLKRGDSLVGGIDGLETLRITIV